MRTGRQPVYSPPMSEDRQVVTVCAEQGESVASFVSPLAPIATILRHRELLGQLTRREIIGRYRGSYLGVLWALLTPLLTLGVFTLVFGAMQHHSWPGSKVSGVMVYPMNLFIGIIVFGIFSEVATRSPGLVTGNPNYVKKAVFPLELIGVATVAGAIVHALMTLIIELIVVFAAQGYVPWTALLLPLAIVPAALLTLGVCWALSAMGVFFRDLANAVGPVVQLVFFLTPIVYPMQVLEGYELAGWALRWLNPFATIVDSARLMVVAGELPDWRALGIVTLLSLVAAMAGYVLFMKSRRYFADAM